MIKNINSFSCTGCGLCEKVCPMDVFRFRDGQMTIAYLGDCVSCLQCVFICPVDAISAVPGKPAKFNMDNEMAEIKKMMGFHDHPKAAETAMPPWMKAKMKEGKDRDAR